MSLSKSFIENQKVKLLAEKERLESEISQLDKYPNYGDQEDDNVQELTDYENNLSAEESLKKSLNEVSQVLKAIDDGNYGKCRECSAEITQELLEALPSAELCSKCQKK